MNTSAEPLSGGFGKPALDLIDPRRRSGHEVAPQFRRPRLSRLNVGGAWNHVVEGDEDRLAARVHIHHGVKQGIDDEMRSPV
jgi:hypothetical protein